jgi:hypothetical protein
MEDLFCFGGIIWLSIANKCISASFSFSYFDSFNFSVLTKNFSNILFDPCFWEVLDIQITSLFWDFISEQTFLLFNNSFLLTKSMLYDKSFIFFISSNQVFSIQCFNCFLSAFWTILFILEIRIFIANKTKLPNLIFLKNKRFNMSERFK